MFQEIIARVATSLSHCQIPYIAIGGQAVLLYGEPRLTADIDMTVGITADNLPDLLVAVEEAGLVVLTDDPTAFVRKTMVLPARDQETGIRVDFILSFTPYEAEAIKWARFIMIGGAKVAFAAPEDVIIHKVFAGRPRDLEDVRGILIKQEGLDFAYIERWLREFDSTFPEKRFLGTFKDLANSI